MPLKDEQVPELHRKMPNVTSETVEKLIVFEVLLLLLAATATCYLPIVHQTQLPTTGCPTSYSYPTCEPHQQQKHLPTAKHHATEGRTSARIARKDA